MMLLSCMERSNPSFGAERKAKKHLNRNEKEHNGTAAWYGMLTEYDHGGDSDVLVEKYGNVINTRFHRNYPGGITGFVDECETALTKLTSRRKLLGTLQNESPHAQRTFT
jgi:ribosomal protein L21E